MVGTMHRFFLLSLALGLSSGCGGGEPQDLLDTAGGLDAVSDSRAGDIPGDLPPADSVPGPGDPCEDGDPCTAGEVLQADGTCGGGTPYTCDDGRTCTEDTCDGRGDCLFTVAAGTCLADGVCAVDGELSFTNPCLRCDAAVSAVAWTPQEDGAACDDGDPCTTGDACADGSCSGLPESCDDGDECTADTCAAEGCLHAALDGTPCTPVDPCIAVAACVDGLCTPGEELDCDDGNPCTGDSCVTGAGCLYAALDGVPCSDGSVCTSGDLCAGDTCTAPEELPCDDGNECTLDLCHPVSGCYHELGDNPCCDEEGINVCDDGNYCTTDSCDPGTGECFHAPNSLPCDDQDPCTGPDLCGGGACAGAEKDCGDGNSCTADWCQPGAGCIHQAEPDASACDDGLECSTGDHCLAGQCVADLSACGCLVDFSEDVSKVTALSIGTDGHPGHGLDVDGLPGTCEPAGSCSAGIDNSLSLLGGFANEALQAAVEDGSVIFLFEHRGFSPTGQVFEVVFHIGELAEPGCAFQTEPCVYLVDAKAFDAECLPLVALDNAQVNGAVLSAGGPGYAFPLVLPLSEGVLLDVTLYSTQLSASVTFSAGKPAALSGVLAGAISKAGMIEALEAVPEDQLPMDKDLIIQMIQGLVKADIDTDGDGAKDAASVGLPFQAISGSIAGFSQE